MENAGLIRVLVVDDHTIVREGIASIIERHPKFELVGQASNGLEALAAYAELLPDVVVMDLRMPEMDGIAAVKAIVDKFPDAKITILSAYDGEEIIYNALRAGALGYLLKDASEQELVETLISVFKGQKRVGYEVATKLVDRLNQNQLTKREVEVIAAAASGKTNQEIALALNISESTVKLHMTRIFTKLHSHDRVSAINTARKRGIL